VSANFPESAIWSWRCDGPFGFANRPSGLRRPMSIHPKILWNRFVRRIQVRDRSDFRISYWPVPDSDTFCGLPPPLSFSSKVALRAPVIVGVNFTVIVQLLPAAIVEPQLSVCE
jgi:hypothetical protein